MAMALKESKLFDLFDNYLNQFNVLYMITL